jgi:hypothetical protein
MNRPQEWRLKIKSGAFALLLPVVFQLDIQPAHSQSLGLWTKTCLKMYKQWQSKPWHKAFAVTSATANNYGQACGASWGYPTKKAAEKSAIAQCSVPHLGSCRIAKSN